MSTPDAKQTCVQSTLRVSRESVSYVDMKNGTNVLATLQFRLAAIMWRKRTKAASN